MKYSLYVILLILIIFIIYYIFRNFNLEGFSFADRIPTPAETQSALDKATNDFSTQTNNVTTAQTAAAAAIQIQNLSPSAQTLQLTLDAATALTKAKTQLAISGRALELAQSLSAIRKAYTIAKNVSDAQQIIVNSAQAAQTRANQTVVDAEMSLSEAVKIQTAAQTAAENAIRQQFLFPSAEKAKITNTAGAALNAAKLNVIKAQKQLESAPGPLQIAKVVLSREQPALTNALANTKKASGQVLAAAAAVQAQFSAEEAVIATEAAAIKSQAEAQNAATKNNTAQAQAQNADSKNNTAQAQASVAQNNTALTSDAPNIAIEAQTAATEAQTAATEAQTAATEAQTVAIKAQTAALEAQTAAIEAAKNATQQTNTHAREILNKVTKSQYSLPSINVGLTNYPGSYRIQSSK